MCVYIYIYIYGVLPRGGVRLGPRLWAHLLRDGVVRAACITCYCYYYYYYYNYYYYYYNYYFLHYYYYYYYYYYYTIMVTVIITMIIIIIIVIIILISPQVRAARGCRPVPRRRGTRRYISTKYVLSDVPTLELHM